MFLGFFTGVILPKVSGENVLELRDGPIVEGPPELFFLERKFSQLFIAFFKDTLMHFLLFKSTVSIHSVLWTSVPLRLSFLSLLGL